MESAIAEDLRHKAIRGIVSLIKLSGEDPERDGLHETPARVVKALLEMTEGYSQDPAVILSKQFDVKCNEMIVVRNIDFTSLCEHHLLPFVGTADLAYIPAQDGKVAGLSKFARLVDCFARRLQVQERLTEEIADSIAQHLGARGVAVVVTASHACMGCRGVRKPGADMVTSAMRGLFKTDPTTRGEFLSIIAKG